MFLLRLFIWISIVTVACSIFCEYCLPILIGLVVMLAFIRLAG